MAEANCGLFPAKQDHTALAGTVFVAFHLKAAESSRIGISIHIKHDPQQSAQCTVLLQNLLIQY
jgi:hypothetical protein